MYLIRVNENDMNKEDNGNESLTVINNNQTDHLQGKIALIVFPTHTTRIFNLK